MVGRSEREADASTRSLSALGEEIQNFQSFITQCELESVS